MMVMMMVIKRFKGVAEVSVQRRIFSRIFKRMGEWVFEISLTAFLRLIFTFAGGVWSSNLQGLG